MKAACASVLYVLSADRLMSLYTRGNGRDAGDELFSDFLFWGLWETLRGEKKRWPMLALGATAIFQCHMISTLLCAGMATGMGLLYLPRVIRKSAWVRFSRRWRRRCCSICLCLCRWRRSFVRA